jgi:hypothetical protein
MKFDRAQVLVEDMFYSEHIFEKMSVYGEYIQTHLQHQVKKAESCISDKDD